MADPLPIPNGFSRRLRDLRRRAGLTQEGLGERAKISRRTLIRWESGTVSPWIPELSAVLRALDASETETAELIRMLGTARAHRERSEPSPERMGELLRTFRLRGDFSIESVATSLGVNPTTVGRWETGALTPDADAQRRLFEHLRVHPREIEALSFAGLSSGDAPVSREAWEEEIDGIRWWWDEWAYVLLDLRFVHLLSRLRAAVSVNPSLPPLLGGSLAAYAGALSNCHRFGEADTYAAEACERLRGDPASGSKPLAAAVLVRARCASFGRSRSHFPRAIGHLDSLAALPLDRELLSWRFAAYAECHSLHGSFEEGLRAVESSIGLTAGRLEEAHALRKFDKARLLLSAGRPEEALAEIPPLTEATPGNIATEALLLSDALHRVGREADAGHWRSVAGRKITEYHLEPIFARQNLSVADLV